MKKITFLFLAISASLLFSCRTAKLPTETITKEVTTTEKHDTTVLIPIKGAFKHDSINVPTPVLYSTPVNRLETELAISETWIESGVLKHTLTQKATVIPVTIKNAIQNTTSTKAETIRVPYPVKKPDGAFKRVLIYSGGTFLLGLILFIFLKIRSNFQLIR